MKIEWNKRSADGGMFGNSLYAQNATESVLFLSYFIGPVLFWRTVWKKVVGMHCKYMISFKMFVLRPMENQLVPSPHMKFQDSTIPLFRRMSWLGIKNDGWMDKLKAIWSLNFFCVRMRFCVHDFAWAFISPNCSLMNWISCASPFVPLRTYGLIQLTWEGPLYTSRGYML